MVATCDVLIDSEVFNSRFAQLQIASVVYMTSMAHWQPELAVHTDALQTQKSMTLLSPRPSALWKQLRRNVTNWDKAQTMPGSVPVVSGFSSGIMSM